MAPREKDRWVDLEERGGWQKPTEQPSAHARPAGLPPKPDTTQDAGQGAGGQGPAEQAGQGSNESS